MKNKKRIMNLEYFREMLQICHRIPNKQFDELPFEKEILAFLRQLGHSGEIKMITDVNINKLHQPWRSFAAVTNKCLSGKSTGYDKYKDAKKSNEMYYPRFTNIIVNFFMTKDQSIPRKNKKFRILHGVHAIASGAEPPKTKASIRKKLSSSDTTMPPPTATSKRLKTSAKVGKPAKEKQPAKSSKAKGLTVLSEVALTEAEQMKLATKRSLTQPHISHASGSSADEGTSIIPRVPDVPTYESNDEEISWKSSEDDEEKISKHDADVDDQSDDDDQDDDDDEQTDSDNDGDDFVHPKFSTHDEEDKDEGSFDPIVQTPSQVENTDDEDNDEDSHGMNVEGDEMDDEGANEEDEANELYKDVNINLAGRDVQMSDVQTTKVFEDTHVTLTPINPEANVSSSSLQDLLNFGSLFGFDHRLKALENNFSEFMLTNQFAEDISLIPDIVDKYLDHRMNEAVKVAVQLQSDRLRDEAQAENEDFLNKLDENIQKIIKEQVKEQIKVQVSKILPKIEKTINEQLEAEVLTRSFNSSKTSHAVAVDLSELELKKILIDKMESNKIKTKNPPLDQTEGPREDEREKNQSQPVHQRKRHPRHLEFETGASDDQPVEEASQHPHCNLAKKVDSRTSFNELMDTPVDFSAFVMNRLKVDTLTPELLAGDFKRLHIQDIEDMLLLLVQGKLTNLTVDERFAFNVSLRMFTRNIIIQRRVEDLQLGVESYQKKLNLTKPDTYRSDLKRKEAYTAYSNPRGFIYQNKDNQNRLMCIIDELQKFSDDTLNDVRIVLDDRLKGIRMQYLPQTIWRRSDKDRAATMIQAIDKQLKTRRIMRSLEKFVGGRLYEGDFRLLQRST
uniref:Uncharacterized protein n=1 Tax=Tanacetum cinerariifolium TaxID=118510 RepID=A0A699HGL2_TANCI|nr:hypothetical protein [Tanacetum cinerariifolium]